MSLLSQYPSVKLLGTRISALRMDDVIDIANEHIANRKNLMIGVVNVAKLVNMHKDIRLRKSVDEADLLLADGVPVVWLSRMLGQPLPQRIAGIDLMYKLLQQASEKHYRVYFLGAKPEVLQKTIEAVQRDFPAVHIAGYKDGYFTEEQEQNIAQAIRDSNSDIIFVGISSPKKENFLRRWRNFMRIPVCHGVGGSFDILAGITKRAPRWMQKVGLEWLYRLIQEPRRMWKRYLITNTIFMKLSLQAILKTKLGRLFRKSTYLTVPGAKARNK